MHDTISSMRGHADPSVEDSDAVQADVHRGASVAAVDIGLLVPAVQSARSREERLALRECGISGESLVS
jgi:hypothetical protein